MDMEQGLLYLLAGYLSGSVLYARVFSGLLRRGDVTEKSRDGNPGTANAFLYGGFWCGALTLVCELLKGFLPVFLFTKRPPAPPLPGFFSALIIAAPVIGHVFPLFFRFPEEKESQSPSAACWDCGLRARRSGGSPLFFFFFPRFCGYARTITELSLPIFARRQLFG